MTSTTLMHLHYESSTADPMYGLPQELVDEIVRQLRDDRRSLLNLSLVSVSFQAAAQAYLFRRIAFVHETRNTDLGYKYVGAEGEEEPFYWVLPSNRAPAFLSIFNDNSNHFIGTLVRDLSLTLPELKPDVDDLTDDLHHALQQMASLKALSITIGYLTKVCMAVVLADLPCQLSRLCLLDKREDSPSDENNAYVTFISSQHSLKYLHFVSSSLLPFSRPFQCPTLETFIGNPIGSSTIFPNLPHITSVGLVDSAWSATVPTSSLIPMSSILSQVRVFTFHSCFFKKPAVEKLFAYMPSLEILEIVLDERSTTNRLTNHAIFMLDYIPMLPRLRRFIWRALPEKNYQRQLSMLARNVQDALTKSWFASLEDFQEAFFAIGPNTDAFLRWSRGKAEPDEVSSAFFHGCTPFDDTVLDRRLTE